jgi:ABC-type glycerol-3-phosphate transport system substrate-binding protein
MPLDGDVTAQGDPWRNGLVAMTIGHQSQTFFHKVEKKTFKFDIARFPVGKHGQITSVSCSSYSIPTKAAQPDAAWELLKHLTSAETQCKITSGKRFASSVTKCQDLMAPDDNMPAHFKEILADPLMGRASVKTMPTMVPPFLSEMRQIWKTEYDPAFTCGGVAISDAAKRVQPKIQELLDKAQAL